MKLLLGLGNIGERYEYTRHNLGWMAVEAFAKKHQSEAFTVKTRLHAQVTSIRLENDTVIAAQPTTYMNLSGQALQALQTFYRVPDESVLIVQDELDLPLGSLRFTLGGGAGGHNGIRSIQELLPDHLFARLRLGIGRPTTPQPVETYVLERFSSHEEEIVRRITENSTKAIQTWIEQGVDTAMQTWNGTRA